MKWINKKKKKKLSWALEAKNSLAVAVTKDGWELSALQGDPKYPPGPQAEIPVPLPGLLNRRECGWNAGQARALLCCQQVLEMQNQCQRFELGFNTLLMKFNGCH